MSATAACEHVQSPNPRHSDWCAKCGRRIDRPSLDPRTAPDPAWMRGFLASAEKLAGLDIGWADRVFDRVSAMERKHGERYRSQSFPELLREIDEEALDLGGWPMLLALMTNALEDEDLAYEAKLLCQEIAAYGVRACNRVEQLRELLSA